MVIKNLETLRYFFRQVETPIFGVGVNAFNRLGGETFTSGYRLISLYDSPDTRLIEKEVPVFSLERKLGHRLRWQVKRNSTSIITHPLVKKYLSSFISPLLVPYKASRKMIAVVQKNNWQLAANPPSLGKGLLEDKVKFRRILEKIGVSVPPGEIVSLGQINFRILAPRYGLPFVVQYPLSGGGKGTFFIRKESDLALMKRSLKKLTRGKINASQEMVVARFVEGPSPSITGCVIDGKILHTSCQYQVLGIKELHQPSSGNGSFCGHDWTAARFSSLVARQAAEAVTKVGTYLHRLGYRGIFGLDFILDQEKEKLFVVECNPRLLGSFPVLTMAQALNREPPIFAFHLLSFLNLSPQLDVSSLNKIMGGSKKGAQMFLHNLSGQGVQVKGAVKAGVYRLGKGGLVYLRPGFRLSHLQDEEEFILTDGVPVPGEWRPPHARLVRILTLRSVLAKPRYKKLNPWAREVAQTVYRQFRLQPTSFWRWRQRFGGVLGNLIKRGKVY